MKNILAKSSISFLPETAVRKISEESLYIDDAESSKGAKDRDVHEIDPDVKRIEHRLKTYSWLPRQLKQVSELYLIGVHSLPFYNRKFIYNSIMQTPDLLELALQSQPSSLIHTIKYYLSKNMNNRLGDENSPIFPMLSHRSGNFYHWIAEYSPLLELLDVYFCITGHRPRILLESEPPKWKIESLSLFGYNKEQLIEYTVGTTLSSAILCSSRVKSGTDYIPSPSEIDFINRKISKNVKKKDHSYSLPKKIYISRERAESRQIMNLDDIWPLLESRGFERVILENMNLYQQINIFKNADIVIGPHGAGFTHIIHSWDISVIEILPEYYPSNFTVIADIIGQDYNYIIGDVVNSNQDMKVDYDKLFKILKSID